MFALEVDAFHAGKFVGWEIENKTDEEIVQDLIQRHCIKRR